MKIASSVATRSTGGRARLIAAASGLIAAGAFVLPTASAAQSAPAATPAEANALVKSLGANQTAGTYLDQASGRMVVNVTTEDAAEAVRDSGAVPKLVKYSSAELAAVDKAIDAVDVGGTAWGVDPKTNKVTVSVDPRVKGAELNRITATAARYGDAVSVTRLDSKLQTFISGGDAIYASAGWRCSAGFNVVSGSTYYNITAGHCTEGYPNWFTNSGLTTSIGPTTGYSFPGNDYGILRYSNTAIPHPGTVGSVDITSAANPTVGATATRRGSTTGTHSGSITGLNYTVNYGGGDIVSGLIRTNICAEPGDSGGPLYSGSVGYGLTSGGSGNCTSGGTVYYQPLVEAINAYGVSIL